MRKIVIAIMGTLSALVLVVSFDASRRGDDVATAAGNGGSDGGGTVDGGSPTGDGNGGSPSLPADGQDQQQDQQQKSTGAGGGSKTSGTFTGAEANTRWGIVQVRITVRNGKITKAKAVQYPQANHHDQAINARAIPQLQQMTVDNQGQVDSVSGATVTSNGYQRSLQSALDQAHL